MMQRFITLLILNYFMPSPTEESASSVKGAPVRWERGQVVGVGAHITTQTRVRVLRAGCARWHILLHFTAGSQQAGLKWTIRDEFSASDYQNNCFNDLLKHKTVSLWFSLSSFCLHRLCSDGEAVHLYYTTNNSRVYHKEELKSFEINAEVDWKSCVN